MGVHRKLPLRRRRWEELDAVSGANLEDCGHVRRIKGKLAQRFHTALESPGSRQHQRPARGGTDDLEGVGNTAGSKNDGSRTRTQGLIGDIKLELAFLDDEGLVFVGMEVRRQVGSGRVET